MDPADIDHQQEESDFNNLDSNEILKRFQIEKKKIKLLKQALKEERRRSTLSNEDMSKATTKIVQVTTELEELKERFKVVQNENKRLVDQILVIQEKEIMLGEKNGSNKSIVDDKDSNEGKSGKRDLEIELKQVKFDKELMKQQLNKAKARIQFLEQSIQKSNHRQQQLISTKNEQIQILQRNLIEADQEIKFLEEELRLMKVGESLGEKFHYSNQKEHLFLVGESKQISNSSNKSTIIDDQEQTINQLQTDVQNLKEENAQKDEIIAALSQRISEKGEEAAQLAYKLSVVKNQIIDSGVFNQKFSVVLKDEQIKKVDKKVNSPKILQFVRDTDQDGEFFLQIVDPDNKDTNKKRIPVLAISNFDIQNGFMFQVTVQQDEGDSIGSNWMKKLINKSKKIDAQKLMFESDHTSSIFESFKKARQRALENQEELNSMMQSTQNY